MTQRLSAPASPLHRRSLLVGSVAAFASALTACDRPSDAKAPPQRPAPPRPEVVIYKTASCGCCKGWVTHMTRAGYPTRVVELEDLTQIREKYGVPFPLSSCHTAVVGGYVVEGHVPPADVDRLLAEKPKARGITVPGMPLGSPGMESPTGESEAYDTLLLLEGGGTRVFAHHA